MGRDPVRNERILADRRERLIHVAEHALRDAGADRHRQNLFWLDVAPAGSEESQEPLLSC